MSKSVICIANNDANASQIVESLKQSGFRDDRISALFPDKSTTRDFAHEKNTKAPEGAVAGAGAGGVAGGGLGLAAGLGLLAVPGVGPLLAAGPIMAALGGAAVGATVGGIAGALVGMGIPEYEAKRYEGRVKDGGILIAVHTENSDEVDTAKDVFENHNAEDISVASEAGVSDGQEAPEGRTSAQRERQTPGRDQHQQAASGDQHTRTGHQTTTDPQQTPARPKQTAGDRSAAGERHRDKPGFPSPDRRMR